MQVGVAAGWQNEIAPLLGQVSGHVTTGTVAATYVRQAGAVSRFAIMDYATPILRYHAGAWPVPLDAFEEGRFTETQVEAVRMSAMAAGQTDSDLRAAAGHGVTGGFIDQATVDRFHPQAVVVTS